MENNHADTLQILPIADTVSGSAARENPKETIDHYNRLASQLWLAPKVGVVAESVLSNVQRGHTTWGSLSGPYGFGKTATAIALWAHAKNADFLSIPPLSCTNFDELAYGIATLAGVQYPKIKKQIDKLFRDVFTKELNPMVQTDAKRYSVSSRTVRQIYRDKLSNGQFTLDTRPHRTVEFLAELGQLAAESSKGLVIILDELQQLLGPLDARSIVQFREFVWGMRTERSSCGLILIMDSLLEARLARWAADILHRIRENGPALQLANIYTREFPLWLWNQLTNTEKRGDLSFQSGALTASVLSSLGQLVERPDLANGPRTVVDVFSRAAVHYKKTGSSYDISHLVDDVHQGQFRYFGEGATIQNALTQILSDEWIKEDDGRRTLVKTLAAFPQGCSQQTLQHYIPHKEQLETARSELFGPLLVELSEGLALEPLQQVRRTRTHWEQILSHCWETLPALDALATRAPDMIYRVLIPRLFPKGTPTWPAWEQLSDEASAVLTGWHILQGTFDDAYPKREIALCITDKEPESWPQDMDVCIAFVCDVSTDSNMIPTAKLLDTEKGCFILMRLPVLKPLTDRIPTDLQRYKKYIQPEPFRPVTILTALHDLEAFLGDLIGNSDVIDTPSLQKEQSEMKRLVAFVDIAVDFILRELLGGQVDVGKGLSIPLRGPELLRALFTQGCQHRFPQYQTLMGTAKWQDILFNYREGIRSDWLSPAQRQGQKEIVMPKAEMYESLFGQMSTAAGDSFIKKLGPFVEVEKKPKSFSLRLTMHPAEIALIDYLKGLSGYQSIPFDAAVEFLRHRGYVQPETEEIIKILVARECLTRDSNEYIRFIPNAEIERDRLDKKIAEINRELFRLEVTDNLDFLSSEASIPNLQAHLDLIKARLKEQIEEQMQELENRVASLHNLIGTVRASTVPQNWATSHLSTHLTGVATKLRQTQDPLLKTLRKELKRVEKELDFSFRPKDVGWAIAQREKRVSFSRSFQKLQDRVTLFETRVKALTFWEVLNNQLRSTDALCTKISEAEPALAMALSQLVEEFKERFATDSWGPLFASSAFSKKLGAVQSDVQGLLYSCVQTFNRELEIIRNQFKPLLPSAQPPKFNILGEGGQRCDSIQEPFQKLYQWACNGFREVAKDCKDKKQSGIPWRRPDNKRENWKKLEDEVDLRLQGADGTLDFETVQRIGMKVLLMQRGFTSVEDIEAIPGLYDNPDSPPDFKKLEQLFGRGQIEIRVDLKSLEEPKAHS